jgi:hypothetical protein
MRPVPLPVPLPLPVLVLGLLLVAAPARAETVCDDPIVDPVAVPVRAGGFDLTRSACLRADFQSRIGAHALVDTPDFYGTLGGDFFIGVRFLEEMGLEWGATIRVVDLTFAQTAVVSATETTYGPISVHAAIADATREDLQVGGMLRLELPFTRAVGLPTNSGAQLAGLVTFAAHDRVALHGRAALLGWFGSSAGGTDLRGAGVLSSDASIRTISWLRASAGLELQAGWYRSGIDHLAARVGAHWRIQGPWRVDVGALLPFAGEERTDVAFTLGLMRDR